MTLTIAAYVETQTMNKRNSKLGISSKTSQTRKMNAIPSRREWRMVGTRGGREIDIPKIET